MKDVIAWLNGELQRRQLLNSQVHEPPVAREEGNWYYIPVYLDMRDAYEKATVLQEIEEAWEEQVVGRVHNLLLIPSAN